MKFMDIIYTIIQIILLPVYIVFFLVFLLIWGLFTITGIGPILQYFFTLRDRKKLDREKYVKEFPKDIQVISIPAGIHGCSKSNPYKVFAIFSEPATPSKYPPVCIPNGLGATAVLISQMQESLVEQGFAVLSFDRLGVGMSDPNLSNENPTAVDVVKELDYVMEKVRPGEKWILLGPSMGSIVAQCYISMFPDKVVGFLNMDGLPYPFHLHRSSFMWAAFIYRIYASIIWTGILRPFIGIALKSSEKMFACKKFPLSIAVAQMNQAGFYGNVAKEMWTMMDCCEMAEIGWGRQSVLRIPEEHLKALIGAAPTISIDFDDATGARNITQMRSKSELGDKWSDPEAVKAATLYLLGKDPSNNTTTASNNNQGTPVKSYLTEKHALSPEQKDIEGEHNLSSQAEALLKFDALERLSLGNNNHLEPVTQFIKGSVLGDAWKNLVVRVMSARNHDFGNSFANSFYNQEMRNLAAAEHALHVILAYDGARTAYPRITHTVMFSKTDDIVRNIVEIANVLETKPSKIKSRDSHPDDNSHLELNEQGI